MLHVTFGGVLGQEQGEDEQGLRRGWASGTRRAGERPAGSWLLQVAALEARTRPVQEGTHVGPATGPQGYGSGRVTPQPGGSLRPWPPTACYRTGGWLGDPGNVLVGHSDRDSGRTPEEDPKSLEGHVLAPENVTASDLRMLEQSESSRRAQLGSRPRVVPPGTAWVRPTQATSAF